MELSRLIESLGKPAAYPFAVAEIESRQTHISVVFLAGSFAFKIKKPIDFSTLAKRRHFCHRRDHISGTRRTSPLEIAGVSSVRMNPLMLMRI